MERKERNTPMRILYIASSGAPSGLYGGSVALLNLIKGVLKNSRNDIAIVLPNKGRLSDMLEKMEIKCYYTFRYTLTIGFTINNGKTIVENFLRFVMMIYRRWRVKRELYSIIEDFKPHIIHTNVGPLDIANKVAEEKRIPHVWHIREYQDIDFNWMFFPSKKYYYRNIHSENNYLIAITKGIYEHFNMRKRDRIIYDGVFDRKENVIFCPIKKKDYFLFVGSISEAKGVKFLIRAYLKYIKKGGKFRLLIAGDGSKQYKNSCLDIIEKNCLTNKVLFLGFQSNVYDLMKKSTALIVPSKFEGFGFITAEAMYNKCLVIGRNTGGTKEQFDNGIKLLNSEIGIRFNNEEELTSSLCDIERKGISQYEQMIENAFFVANELYNNQKYSELVLDYYQWILEDYKKHIKYLV
jgi:glycosyltransferase involved in cell wall biosynthesis